MHFIHEYGLIAVAAIVGLECLGLPVPGETALLSAAIYAGAKHNLNIVSVILTAAIAAIIGRMLGYVIGRILLYGVAAALGWFVHPLIAVGIFIFIVGYYAWTSQGILTGR